MKNYELTYLIIPDISTEEAKTLSEKIAGFISELNGTVINNINPEKKRLAYPIKKKIDAFLGSIEFSIAPELTKDFKKKIDTETQILRYLITVKLKERERPVKKPKKEIPIEEKPKKQKVDLENMDQKIDEILK